MFKGEAQELKERDERARRLHSILAPGLQSPGQGGGARAGGGEGGDLRLHRDTLPDERKQVQGEHLRGRCEKNLGAARRAG